MATTILGLPTLEAAQNQKYLTSNQALSYIDALINLTVFNRTTTTTPVSPSDGDRYIVGPSATGVWSGEDNRIAVFIGSNWIFFTPAEGWRAYDQGVNERLLWDGSAWVLDSGSSGSLGTFGSSHQFFTVEEELTGLSGSSVSSTFVFPNQSLIYGVSCRVTSAITGAASFDVGDGTTVSRFGGSIPVTLGQTNQGVIGPSGNYSSTNVVLTANGSNFTGGSVRIAAHYSVLNAPTS